ncbi:hypothetical protein [Synechocystis sp. LKSZ1]|uniref:hypothetical protein n=1 Tax=Synechocystis sp. LKSZ1 TaxID=3144951 RepID=UPI00336BBA79
MMMTIAALIEVLSQYDPSLPVVVQGYEGGYNDVSILETLDIQFDVNTEDYYGAHGDVRGQLDPTKPLNSVLVLKGLNPNCDNP